MVICDHTDPQESTEIEGIARGYPNMVFWQNKVFQGKPNHITQLETMVSVSNTTP